jgi:hypothetical protein
MPTDPPIACSLEGNALSDRLADMAQLGRAALLDANTAGGRAQLRFTAGEEIRERLDGIVAAEAGCCAFLDMEVTEEPGVLSLTIVAPAGAEPVLEDLVGAFTTRGRRSRPARDR